MTCTHDIIEKDNACADGMCPICLAADNAQLIAVLELIAGTAKDKLQAMQARSGLASIGWKP
jgi:hypothetical protein